MGSMGQGGRGEGRNMVATVWILKMGCDGKQEVTSHICTVSTWWFVTTGCDRKQEVTCM